MKEKIVLKWTPENTHKNGVDDNGRRGERN